MSDIVSDAIKALDTHADHCHGCPPSWSPNFGATPMCVTGRRLWVELGEAVKRRDCER